MLAKTTLFSCNKICPQSTYFKPERSPETLRELPWHPKHENQLLSSWKDGGGERFGAYWGLLGWGRQRAGDLVCWVGFTGPGSLLLRGQGRRGRKGQGDVWRSDGEPGATEGGLVPSHISTPAGAPLGFMGEQGISAIPPMNHLFCLLGSALSIKFEAPVRLLYTAGASISGRKSTQHPPAWAESPLPPASLPESCWKGVGHSFAT